MALAKNTRDSVIRLRRQHSESSAFCPVLGASALLIVVALSIVACFIVYPDAHEVFEDMRIVRADALCAVNSGNKKQAQRQFKVWDDLARKLEIGTYLRRWHLTPAEQDGARRLRQLIDQLDDVVDVKHTKQRKTLTVSVNQSYQLPTRVPGKGRKYALAGRVGAEGRKAIRSIAGDCRVRGVRELAYRSLLQEH